MNRSNTRFAGILQLLFILLVVVCIQALTSTCLTAQDQADLSAIEDRYARGCIEALDSRPPPIVNCSGENDPIHGALGISFNSCNIFGVCRRGKDLINAIAAPNNNIVAVLIGAVPGLEVSLFLVAIGLIGCKNSRRRKTFTISGFEHQLLAHHRISPTTTLRPRLLVALVILMMTLNPLAIFAQPTITNLGTLTGGSLSIANGISADGTTIIGYSNFGEFSSNRAFRWTTSGGMQDLGTLPAYPDNIGYGVNADGSVIVGGSSGFTHAWRWTAAAGMTDLGTLPGGSNLIAKSVSGDGNWVVGWSQVNGGTQLRPFLWSNVAGMMELSLLTGGNAGQAAAISGNGMYVAGQSTFAGSGSATRAVRWGPNGIVDLGSLVSGGSAYATAISHDGPVVVGVTATNNGDRAFRWTQANGMENLGVVPPQGTFPTSIAYAINGNGNVIGGRSNSNAFLWTETTGPVDLKAWLISQGADLSNWVLSDVTGLSYDGSVITGTGFFNNQQRAWVVNLNTPIPEPSFGWIIAAFAVIASSRYQRRLPMNS